MYYLFRKGYGLVARPFNFQNRKDLQTVEEFIRNAEPVIIVSDLTDIEEFENCIVSVHDIIIEN